MKLNKLFGVTFLLLSLICFKFYPVDDMFTEHFRFGYTFLSIFFGAYFLSRVKDV